MTDLVLGDDHTLFAEALAGVLAKHAFVVRAVTRGISGVIDAVREHQPDVCLLDRHFSDGDAIDAIDNIIGHSPRTRVLILTADNEADGAMRALRSGAHGYVHKSAGFDALVDALARIMDSDGVVVEVPRQRIAPPSQDTQELADARRLAGYLTARERECLELIVEGLGTDAMAKRLGVSNTTVRTHSQRLLNKLGVHSRLEAASFAVRYALLDMPPRR
jgi:two-component system nitrate/nitrite response regulator NarL